MKIATGNDLKTGDVVWWDGEGWSRHIGDAVDVGEQGPALIAAEEASRRVNVPYLIEAEPGADAPRPAHIKDRIRAFGPTVRADLAIQPADRQAGNWVI
jgi:hypothetical protein